MEPVNPDMQITGNGLENAFGRVEKAIDAHAKLKRVKNILGEPDLVVSRLGFTLHIPVQLKGRHKKPFTIRGEGDTLEGAVTDLINALDHWAEALS